MIRAIELNKFLKEIIFKHIEERLFFNKSNIGVFPMHGMHFTFIEVDDLERDYEIEYEMKLFSESFKDNGNSFKKDYELKYHEKDIIKPEPSAKLLNFINRIKL